MLKERLSNTIKVIINAHRKFANLSTWYSIFERLFLKYLCYFINKIVSINQVLACIVYCYYLPIIVIVFLRKVKDTRGEGDLFITPSTIILSKVNG